MAEVIAKNLFQEILLAPARTGADELLIVSGFATASMAHVHLDEIESRVRLVYGMAPSAGVSLADDSMFKQLKQRGRFNCHYRVESPPVHSKVYVWMSHGSPEKAFIGSANYTQSGFFGTHQGEAMMEADPEQALSYFNEILSGSLEVGHNDIERHVTLYSRENVPYSHRGTSHSSQRTNTPVTDCVRLPLVTRRTGEPGVRSGLNWGQRPELRRNPNQAYIPVPAPVGRRGFFPPRATRFTVRADDGFTFMASTAQDDAKGIHTPDGNNILGAYFRRRLGVASGAPVTGNHLRTYGRTDVELCKLDDETYFMDFSV